MLSKTIAVANLVLFLFPLCKLVTCHVQMIDPLPRGSLPGTRLTVGIQPVDRLAPLDKKGFFPAGSKEPTPGAGKRSQMSAVTRWEEFRPLKRGFPWRAGICGDPKGSFPQDHKRGGRFYFDAKISKTYISGSIISLKVAVVEHHNGYYMFHICDVSRCGGEISEKCFNNGSCRELRRAKNYLCDSQGTRTCGPIDRRNPGRWYAPCDGTNKKNGVSKYGFKNELKYKLPDGFRCHHCVLHMFYTSANNCNPPGVRQYFLGPDRPSWGNCPGQGGAKGGFASNQRDCGPGIFPEEYYNCADVRIIGRNEIRRSPIERIEFGEIRGKKFIVLQKLWSRTNYIFMNTFKKYTIRITMNRPIYSIYYTTSYGGGKGITRKAVPVAPFFVFGFQDGRPFPWKFPRLKNHFKLAINCDGFKEVTELFLKGN